VAGTDVDYYYNIVEQKEQWGGVCCITRYVRGESITFIVIMLSL